MSDAQISYPERPCTQILVKSPGWFRYECSEKPRADGIDAKIATIPRGRCGRAEARPLA
jgi:hypothetical protein